MPVAVFIDNVDECFEGYLDYWYNAQISLIKAIYNLMRIKSGFKLYASIRKEALLKIQSEMSLQYNGVCLDLNYTLSDLEDIFEDNIQKEKPSKLVDPNNKANPIVALIGSNKIRHGFVDEEEDITNHIFRHTLKRPRDLMVIGGKIVQTDKNDRDLFTDRGKEKFKSIVNDAAADIATSYLEEVLPHLSIIKTELDVVLSKINSNVIEKYQIYDICLNFNKNIKCDEIDCKECGGKHIFCELYKIGLLGYVNDHPLKKGAMIQTFLPIGEQTFESVGLLPDSEKYLLHPVLAEYTRKKNNKFRTHDDRLNIIGYDRPWWKNKSQKKRLENQLWKAVNNNEL